MVRWRNLRWPSAPPEPDRRARRKNGPAFKKIVLQKMFLRYALACRKLRHIYHNSNLEILNIYFNPNFMKDESRSQLWKSPVFDRQGKKVS